ncbi:hypothetical protein [Streptomyces endophyticus]|uniref:TetR family transcriptional regulator n=1 Tax=Streptomyces endophyticus TaxID=714166 RepID=A0ABU6FIZ7_9ACTN|nr:hypothetical protein [Streptomyces endophyticus]MEB8344034.1 hypothetical protein [Streptomyces endophyticus]
MPRVRVAELALTDRQFLRRNWPHADTLTRLSAEVELDRVLNGVAARVGHLGPPDPVCCLAETLVLATRRVREHPVTRATARTAPELLSSALVCWESTLHARAWNWLRSQVHCLGPERRAQAEALTYQLFAAALPFALGQAPPGDGLQDRIDERVRAVTHLCLTGVADCALH